MEQVHAYVVLREVVARRQPGLVEAQRPVGRGEQLTVESDLDVSIAGTDGDGVARAHAMVNGGVACTIPAAAFDAGQPPVRPACRLYTAGPESVGPCPRAQEQPGLASSSVSYE